MLRSYVVHEVGPDRFTIGPEMKDDPCERCGAASTVNICGGDGRLHHHGRVHTMNDGLEALCGSCADAANAEWPQPRWFDQR